MNRPFSIVNGQFVPADQAALNVADLAVQRGYGIFDFFRTRRGRPAFLEDHLDRFYSSASRMRLECSFGRDDLRSLLDELLARNDIADSGVRIGLTGGYSPDGYAIDKPNLFVTQRPFTADAELAARGVRLMTHPYRRQFADVKTIDYLMAVWIQPLLRERGADDVLYHLDGLVSECPRSNLFIVAAGDRLVTPRSHVLMGVTRKHVIRLAAGRLQVVEGDVGMHDVLAARECFLTSTTRGIVSVVQVDGRPIGTGQTGEITRWIAAEYDQACLHG